ncbi:MAG: dipeptidase, partial [Planctomycetota bacterium]
AAAAAEVESQLAAAGCETETVPTDGFPIVVGRTPAVPDAPTVLVYGHYDVQPPDPLDKWVTPPFEPAVRDGHVYARGATDDKGQMLTHVVAAAAWSRACGGPPLNVVFVIEGEEEVGSNNLDRFLEARRDDLACDVAVISDTSQYGPGMPAITYGLRGVAAVEFTVRGPSHDLHSGLFGGTVANAATAAARLVASLHNEDGRVAVDSFYDAVLEVSAKERAQFAALPFDEVTYLEGAGSTAAVGEAGFSTLERRWIRPTCEVNGISGGYLGEGPKTIVPSEATVKITCRLVPDQDPAAITAAVEKHLRDRLPAGVSMTFETYHGCPGFVLDPEGPHATAATAAIDRAFGTKPVYIREGGSIPVVESLKRILGVDTLLLG